MTMDENFLRYLQGAGQDFNPYAAGNKQYGASGAPNTGASDPSGYLDRDRQLKAKNNAILQRLKARVNSRFMSSANLNPNGQINGN